MCLVCAAAVVFSTNYFRELLWLGVVGFVVDVMLTRTQLALKVKEAKDTTRKAKPKARPQARCDRIIIQNLYIKSNSCLHYCWYDVTCYTYSQYEVCNNH